MKRLALPLLLAAFLFATHAQAQQVATTDLLPAAPHYFASFLPFFNGVSATPANPAAVQWGGPSNVVVGTMNVDEGSPSVGYSGSYLGGRAVGQNYAGALEYSDASGTGQHEATLGLSLSMALGSLALGYGYDGYQEKVAGDDGKGHNLGLSWRLGDSFYLGLGAGREKINGESRSTSMYGLAFRTEGDTRWYFAYDVIDKQDFPVAGLGAKENRTTLQANFGGLALGVSSAKIVVATGGNELTATFYDIGWVPTKSGWSIVLHMMDGDAAGTPEKGTNLTVGYLF